MKLRNILLAIVIISFTVEILSKVNDKAELNLNNKETEQLLKKKHKKKLRKTQVKQLPVMAPPNDSLTNLTYRNFNYTYDTLNLIDYKAQLKSWDYKMMDKQLEEVYKTMLTKNLPYKTLFSDRAYVEIFLQQFDQCDTNHDQTLDITEFKACMKSDFYLRKITPTPANIAALSNYTDPDFFYQSIFNILDTQKFNFLNFHAYMELRLFVFSWRKCSVIGPFLEETSWECALEIVGEYKLASRTTLRNTFYMCIELSNSQNSRNIDFISFMMFASSVRLFGKINTKDDGDISKSEFNLILDENMLPSRYNQKVVDQFFILMKEDDKKNHGIDYQSFIYYDFALSMFSFGNQTRKYFANETEFTQILQNPLFNSYMLSQISQTPMTNFTTASYQMYTYQNIKNYNDEQDFLLKFLEGKTSKLGSAISAKKNLKFQTRSQNKDIIPPGQIYKLASNVNFSLPFIASNIFSVIDINSDGFIDFYDYGSFYSILYLFVKFDPFQKGRLVAGDVFDKFHYYSDFPRISADLKKRSTRFSLINQDTYVDFFTALVILKIDDIVALYTRKTDKSTLYEVELKRIFQKVNLRFISEGVLNKCLRGLDNLNIPKYDWDCAFMAGAQQNINYIESASAYNTAQAFNLTLTNTVFYNVDPALNTTAAAAPKARRRY